MKHFHYFGLAAAALIFAAGCTKGPGSTAAPALYPLTLNLSSAAPSRSAFSGEARLISQAEWVRVTVKRSGTNIVEYSNSSPWTSASRTISLTPGIKEISVTALFGFDSGEGFRSLTQTYSGLLSSVTVPAVSTVNVVISPEDSRIKIGSIAVNNSASRLASGDRFEVCGIYVQDFSDDYPGAPLFADHANECGNQGVTAYYGTVSWTGNAPSSSQTLFVPGYDDVAYGGTENPYFYVNICDASSYDDGESLSWTKHLRADTAFNVNVDPITIGGSRTFNQYFFVPPGSVNAKLVIWVKTQQNGSQDFYYHIPLPELQAGKSYEIASATLTRYGSTDPESPLEFGDQDFSITVHGYDPVSVTDGTTI